MPYLQNASAMRVNDASNHVQLSGTEAMTASQPERLKPELAGLPLTLDMHMWRLAAVETREEEPIGPPGYR
jgi:hypothetical protein